MKTRTKCEFERLLNETPLPTSCLPPKHKFAQGRAPTQYGAWLKAHRPEEFYRRYEAWRTRP